MYGRAAAHVPSEMKAGATTTRAQPGGPKRLRAPARNDAIRPECLILLIIEYGDLDQARSTGRQVSRSPVAGSARCPSAAPTAGVLRWPDARLGWDSGAGRARRLAAGLRLSIELL